MTSPTTSTGFIRARGSMAVRNTKIMFLSVKELSTPEEQGKSCDSSTLLKQINTENSEKPAMFTREPGPAS